MTRDALANQCELNTSPSQTWSENRRKLAHMLPGLIPFVMWFVYHEDPLPAWNLLVAAGVVAVLTLIAMRNSRGIQRGHEENWRRTCLTYALPSLAVLICFPARAEYASVVLTVLAFGDSSAALAGGMFGKRRLPWNREKTFVGLIAFAVIGSVLGSLAYWGEARPAVSWQVAAVCGCTAGMLGAAAESWRSRIDDNLRISVAAAIGVIVTSTLLVDTY